MDEIMELTEQQRKCIPNVRFELIPISSLVSNQQYQRSVSENHIRKAVADFDVHQINPVKVSRRGGVNYVFDGQHTIEMVASQSESRNTPVWCMVYEDLRYQEEAHVFSEQQKHTKALLPYEVFAAHIEAGDERQSRIKAIVESHGLTVTNTQTPDGICAVTTLERLYEKYGEQVLSETIALALETWEREMNSLSGNFLTAIAKILVIYGDALNKTLFKEHVGQKSVKSIIRTAKERHPGVMGFAEAMMLAYNEKNKQHRLSLRMLYGGKKVSAVPEEEEEAQE